MDEIEMMMKKSHSVAARAARNYREEEVRKYEALRNHRGNFRTADDGRGFRTGSEGGAGLDGRSGFCVWGVGGSVRKSREGIGNGYRWT